MRSIRIWIASGCRGDQAGEGQVSAIAHDVLWKRTAPDCVRDMARQHLLIETPFSVSEINSFGHLQTWLSQTSQALAIGRGLWNRGVSSARPQQQLACAA
jgi:hypothetical protein